VHIKTFKEKPELRHVIMHKPKTIETNILRKPRDCVENVEYENH